MLIYDQPINPAKDPAKDLTRDQAKSLTTSGVRSTAAGFSVLDLVQLLWRANCSWSTAN